MSFGIKFGYCSTFYSYAIKLSINNKLTADQTKLRIPNLVNTKWNMRRIIQMSRIKIGISIINEAVEPISKTSFTKDRKPQQKKLSQAKIN